MIPQPCTRTVFWFGYDLTARCLRRPGHPGNHSDGIWFFDEFGLRVDGTRHAHDRRELVSA